VSASPHEPDEGRETCSRRSWLEDTYARIAIETIHVDRDDGAGIGAVNPNRRGCRSRPPGPAHASRLARRSEGARTRDECEDNPNLQSCPFRGGAGAGVLTGAAGGALGAAPGAEAAAGAGAAPGATRAPGGAAPGRARRSVVVMTRLERDVGVPPSVWR